MAENVAQLVINRGRSGTKSLRKGDLLQDGVIVVNRRYGPTEKKTRIHRPACWCAYVISARLGAGKRPLKKQQYWHYDAYEKARLAYPDSMPCGKCRPDRQQPVP